MQLNWLYFCGICQMIPLKVWPNTAQHFCLVCSHQSICMSSFMFSYCRSRWIASIFSGSTAACPQCCGEVCGRSTSSWPCDGNTTWSTLASDRNSDHIQTVHLDACVCAWCCAGLHPKHVDLGDWTAWSQLRSAASGSYDVPRTRTKFGTRAFSVKPDRQRGMLCH